MDTMASADSKLLGQLRVLWEQALVKRTARYGPDYPHSTELIEDLATLYQAEKKWDLLVLLRRETLRRISKDENVSVSQITMEYDRTSAFVLLMKAYRDQGDIVALDNLRMNLMRLAHVSQDYPTICNTAYILVDHGFMSEARELCTRAREMTRNSDYLPELCVLAQLLIRADMDDEAEQIGHRILTKVEERDASLIDKESIEGVFTLARTFIRIRRQREDIGTLLEAAARDLSARKADITSRQEHGKEPNMLPDTRELGMDGSQITSLAPEHDPYEGVLPGKSHELVVEPWLTDKLSDIVADDPEQNSQTLETSQSSKDSLHAALVTAAEQGNIEEVTRAIRLGADVNNTPAGRKVPLCAAVAGGNLEVVRFLLANGAKPLDDICDGPLDHAVRAGSEPIIRILLRYGVGISHGDALMAAVKLDARAIVKTLLDHSLSQDGVPLCEGIRPTLLAESVTMGMLEMTKLLIERGFSPKRCPAALFVAVSKGFHELTSLLLENGADITYRDPTSYTALIHAALMGQSQIVDQFLPYTSKYLVIEALVAAASVGEEATFDILWRRCQPEDVAGIGSGVIVAATRSGHVGIMRKLLQHRDLFEQWPLETLPLATPKPLEYMAGVSGPPKFNDVEVGKRYNITDACIVACSRGQVEVMKLLMKDGSRKIPEEEVRGAIQGRHYRMILHLFSVGADPSPKILQLALEESDAQVCQILLDKVTFGNRHKIQLGKCLSIAARKGDVILAE